MNRSLAIFSATVLCGITGLALGGPLVPPAGSVSSSMKTLVDVEPRIAINAANTPGDASTLFKITQGGSYYLTGNILGAAGKYGIQVAANGVTIDLNGFDLIGTAGSLDGIHAEPSFRTDVHNGSARLWGGMGINLHDASNCEIAHVTASNNGAGGMTAGMSSRILDCTAVGNTGSGIVGYGRSTITDCVASGNTVDGIYAGAATKVRQCSSTSNGDDGIQCESNCLISGNSCMENGPNASGAGVYVTGSSSRIEDNALNGNHYGLLTSQTASANLIVKNSASANFTNFLIQSGNQAAPVIANPGAGGFGTTNAWSNLSY